MTSAEAAASLRGEAPRSGDARASFLTGFLKGLVDRFDESVANTALLLVTEREVLDHAAAFVNAPAADASRATSFPMEDSGALREGFESGYAHASGQRRLGGGES